MSTEPTRKERYEAHMASSSEEWREIAGTAGKYLVSNRGRIRSLSRGRNLIMRLSPLRGGYVCATIFFGNVGRTCSVHRLVALAFIENPHGLPEVNHKNGVKNDNRVDNLEWVTRSQNMQHRGFLPLSPTGERHWKSVLSSAQVIEIRHRKLAGETVRALAEAFGVCHGTISYATGKGWKYISEVRSGVNTANAPEQSIQ